MLTESGEFDILAFKSELKASRIRAGLSISEAARRLGYSNHTKVNNWERHTCDMLPKIPDFIKLMAVYGEEPIFSEGENGDC